MATAKQLAFIEYYVVHWNASEAARQAGYSERTAYSIGSELLKKPEVKEAIRNKLAELQATADEVLTRLTSQARGTMDDFLRISDDGAAELDFVKAKQLGRLHLIKKVKSTRRVKDGETEITNEVELYDAQAALEKLGRSHKLFTDKVLHGNDPDNPLPPDSTPESRAQAALELTEWQRQMREQLSGTSVPLTPPTSSTTTAG